MKRRMELVKLFDCKIDIKNDVEKVLFCKNGGYQGYFVGIYKSNGLRVITTRVKNFLEENYKIKNENTD